MCRPSGGLRALRPYIDGTTPLIRHYERTFGRFYFLEFPYSIMLQIVAIITVILLGNAALFARLQNRPGPSQQTIQGVLKVGSEC